MSKPAKDMSSKLACQLMPNPDFLSEADFIDDKTGKLREYTLPIATVLKEDLQLPGRSGLVPKIVVGFQGATKRLVLNKTNLAAIKGKYGKAVSDWLGKPVTLFYNPDVRMGRDVVGGVRIKK